MTCDVLSRGVTQHVTPCDVSHVRHVSWHNNPCSQQITTKYYPAIREYKVIRESITGHGMGPGPDGLTLTLLLKYLAQCEAINYVWYFQERVWTRGPTLLGALYLPRAEPSTQLVEVSIFKKLLIWTYVRAVNTQLTAVHMKYDSNKLQLNHFYMCNIDIIANTMQHF